MLSELGSCVLSNTKCAFVCLGCMSFSNCELSKSMLQLSKTLIKFLSVQYFISKCFIVTCTQHRAILKRETLDNRQKLTRKKYILRMAQ